MKNELNDVTDRYDDQLNPAVQIASGRTGKELIEAAARRAVEAITGFNPRVYRHVNPTHAAEGFVEREFAPFAELANGIQVIKRSPYGCRFCDSGILRSSSKDHDDDCGYRIAFDALAEVEKMGKQDANTE